jgi:glycosyltransferase involved in cell wall biosynthesis
MSPGKGKRPPAEDADAAPTAKRPRGAARDASRASDDANATPSSAADVDVKIVDVVDPLVSVLMPCRNAMPWLPDCVASVLAQRGLAKRGGLELIAVDDSSTDGSREWLEACAAALAAADEKAGEDEDEDEDEDEEEDEEDDDDAHAFPPDRLAWESDKVVPTSVAAAVRARVRGNTLVVLTVAPFGRSGQGKALNLAYESARGTLVGEMESDDLRPPSRGRSTRTRGGTA